MPLPVEDVVEIERLISRFNFAFDRRDAKGFAECFTADGGFLLGDDEQARGHDGLAAYVDDGARPASTRHHVGIGAGGRYIGDRSGVLHGVRVEPGCGISGDRAGDLPRRVDERCGWLALQ